MQTKMNYKGNPSNFQRFVFWVCRKPCKILAFFKHFREVQEKVGESMMVLYITSENDQNKDIWTYSDFMDTVT